MSKDVQSGKSGKLLMPVLITLYYGDAFVYDTLPVAKPDKAPRPRMTVEAKAKRSLKLFIF